MNTKLTLRLDDRVIKKAKIYAKSHKISLSKMVEAYLDSLTSEEDTGNNKSITPLVESLSGVINMSPEFDYKKEYAEYLSEKYK